MYITIARPGEDLAAVARRTGVSAETLATANGLPGSRLTPGQALLVLSSRYIVQPGDTLSAIAEQSGLSTAELRRANPGLGSVLYPGRPLRIPAPARRRIEVIGYLPLTDPGVTADAVRAWARHLTWVPIFSYLIDAEGNVTPVDDAGAIAAVRAAGARPLMSIANMRPGGAFEPEIARSLITRPDVRERVITAILQTVEAKGYAGVDSDIENIDRDLRDGYVDFLRELKERLGPQRLLNVAVPPKYDETTLAYARGHDYAGIGQVADRVYIMNYEFSWVGGPPGPIAPLPRYRRVLQYAARLIPREKILAGISTVAYDWELPDTPENTARPLPADRAVQLAVENGVPIRYSEPQDSPWFRYGGEQSQREVWFEDARSLLAKLTAIRSLGLGGFGIWHLGSPSSQLITLTDQLFTTAGES